MSTLPETNFLYQSPEKGTSPIMKEIIKKKEKLGAYSLNPNKLGIAKAFLTSS
jgi:hypothetical protein